MPQSNQPTLRIGTRGSALALWQAEEVQKLLSEKHPGVATELVIIKPEGDVDKHSSLQQIGGRGVFTSALQMRMLANEIDLAVHSTKDLPSLAPHGIAIAAFPQREDARDALISRHGVGLAELPPNPVIGTSSRRRSAQILQMRPDAQIHDLRGNIDTRLRKGLSEDFDAVILAAAGLTRMGWDDQVTEFLPVDVSCPAPGQGALAIETRIDPDPAWDLVRELDDPRVRTAVMVERAFLRGVGGGCSTPIGAHASIEHMHGIATVRFWGMLGSDDGSRLERTYAEWSVDSAIDEAFATADEMMRVVSPKWTGVDIANPLEGRTILITGTESHIAAMSDDLAARGANAHALQTVQIETQPATLPDSYDWLVITSKHAIPAIDWSTVTAPVAVVGEGTADALKSAGVEADLVAAGPGAEQLAAELVAREVSGKKIVCVVSDIARDVLAKELTAVGAEVETLHGYTNTPMTDIAAELRNHIAAGEMEAVTFASPSSVHAFQQMIGIDLPALSGAAMFAIGPTTADAMREAGLPVHAMAQQSTVTGLTEELARYFGGEKNQ